MPNGGSRRGPIEPRDVHEGNSLGLREVLVLAADRMRRCSK